MARNVWEKRRKITTITPTIEISKRQILYFLRYLIKVVRLIPVLRATSTSLMPAWYSLKACCKRGRLEAYSHRNSFPWLGKGAVSDVQMSLKKLPKKERHTGCNCSRIRSLHNPVTVQVGATALTHYCGAILIASPLTSKRIAWLLTITPEALLGWEA